MPLLGSTSNHLKVHVSTTADTKGISATERAIGKLGRALGAEGYSGTGGGFLRTANKSFGFLGRSITGIGALARSAAVPVGMLGAALTAAGGFAVKSAGDFEQNRIAFETMLGSADKAGKLLRQISDFAAKTPFELPQVVDGAKSLMAYGIAADKIIPTFNALGNIAAGVGRDKLPQLTLAYGQVRAATRLTGAELRQFTEAGVPLLEVLAKQSGKTAAQLKEDMEKGAAPSFEEVERALFSMSQEGGKFFNLMERQSKTFGGTMSNLKDQVGRVARSIVGISETGEIREGSLFAHLTAGGMKLLSWLDKNGPAIANKAESMLDGFVEFAGNAKDSLKDIIPPAIAVGQRIGSYLSPKVGALRNSVEKLLPTLATFLNTYIRPLAQAAGGLLVGALGLAIDSLNALARAARPVVNWLNNNAMAVRAFAYALGTLYVAFQVTRAFSALQIALTTLRMGFVASTLATVGLRGALGALMVSIGPLGWILGGLSVVAGVLISQWQKGAEKASTQALAQDRLREATQRLRDAQTALRDSQLALEGSSLGVERAQRTYNEAVRQYGPRSLEAREAAHNLRQAQNELKDATVRAKDAQNALNKAQNNIVVSAPAVVSKLRSIRLELGNVSGAALGAANNISKVIQNAARAPQGSNYTIQGAGGVPRAGGVQGGRATGAANYGGGTTWVGERGPELVNLPRGSRIYPAQQSRQMAQSAAVSSTTSVSIQNVNLHTVAAAKEFFRQINDDTLLSSRGFAPAGGMA